MPLLNKRIDSGIWAVSCTSKDIISLSARNPRSGRKVNIFRRLQRSGNQHSPTVAEVCAELEPLTTTVILGDFNLHHLLWSVMHRRPNLPLPSYVLGMQLLRK